MVIELTGEQEAMVRRVAAQHGTTPGELVVTALQQWDFVDGPADDLEERRIVEERLAEADKQDTVWVSHEEVGRRMGLL